MTNNLAIIIIVLRLIEKGLNYQGIGRNKRKCSRIKTKKMCQIYQKGVKITNTFILFRGRDKPELLSIFGQGEIGSVNECIPLQVGTFKSNLNIFNNISLLIFLKGCTLKWLIIPLTSIFQFLVLIYNYIGY